MELNEWTEFFAGPSYDGAPGFKNTTAFAEVVEALPGWPSLPAGKYHLVDAGTEPKS